MRKKIFIISGAVLLIIFFLFSFWSKKSETSPIAKTLGDTKKEEQEKVKEYRDKYSLDESNIEYNDFMIQAPSGIIVDVQEGKIIYEKDMHKKLAPASVTKIMTAIIALDNIGLDEKLEVSKKASEMQAFKINFNMGEKIKTEDLLYGLMMISANDAAEVLAEGIDGDRNTFINKMNKKGKYLELAETNFKNTCGLDEEGHTSSAYDMAKITYYGLKEYPDILKYMGRKSEYSMPETKDNAPHWWGGHVSTTLNTYPEVIGAKTGFTDDARNTFVGIGEKGDKKFIFIFMGSDRGNEDARALLKYSLDNI